MQSLLYPCLLLLGCVNHSKTSPFGNSFLWYKPLTHYLHCTMSTWVKYEKTIVTWIRCIMNKRIQAPGRPPFLMQHHPPTHPWCLHFSNKKVLFLQKITPLYYLTLYLLYNIGMWNAGIVHHKKLKPLLVWLTQHHQVLRTSTSYKLKYSPLDYYMYYNNTRYVWVYRRLDPHKSNRDRKWGKVRIIKH